MWRRWLAGQPQIPGAEECRPMWVSAAHVNVHIGFSMLAVLHVSDFSLQAVLRLEHELASRPVALIDETRRPPVVVACTARAHAAGVEPGQTAPQAMARCAAVS